MLGVIFSNIYDAKLKTLTAKRTVASLPFGGRYRMVDFVLSNMINAGIKNIGVITKYNYSSLMHHLGDLGDWDLDVKGSSVRFLPPFSYGSGEVYRGKIEALCGAIKFLEKRNEEYVVMSDCINICNIDLKDVLNSHIKSNADITVVVNEENTEKTYDMVVDEKSRYPRINTKCTHNDVCSVGIFIIRRTKLIELVKKSADEGYYHFERDIIQREIICQNLTLNLYKFYGTVLRCESEEDYFKNNLLINDESLKDSLFVKQRPVFTRSSDSVPAIIGNHVCICSSTVSDGCHIRGDVENSVIFENVKIETGCRIKNSVIMDNVRIGENSSITNAIIDKNIVIEKNTVLCGTKSHPAIIF